MAGEIRSVADLRHLQRLGHCSRIALDGAQLAPHDRIGLPALLPVAGKSLTAAQDAGNLTSNGGLIVLREAANRLELAGVIADPLPDTRNQLFVVHSYRAMVTARMMAITAGSISPTRPYRTG